MSLYRKTYLCVCEGQQEDLYLKRFASLLKVPQQRVITFNTVIGNPDKLNKNYVEYDSAALFDFDFNQVEFRKNIEICDKLKKANNKGKNRKNVSHAYSNVNFDLWLILHKEDYNKSVTNNSAYVRDVIRLFVLEGEADIKSKDTMGKILAQITLADVKSAIKRAENIRARKIISDRVNIGTSETYPDPDFSIHKFLEAVLVDCGERIE